MSWENRWQQVPIPHAEILTRDLSKCQRQIVKQLHATHGFFAAERRANKYRKLNSRRQIQEPTP